MGCAFLAESDDFVVCFDVRQQIAVTCRKLRTRPDGDVDHEGRKQSNREKTYCDASSRLSIGLTKSGLDERHAAIVRMGPKQRKTVPSMSICYTVRMWNS